VILLLNGAFGIGKTTVAHALVRRLPRTVIFDPEWIGIPLQRLTRVLGMTVDDFQDLQLWRSVTAATLRIVRLFWPTVVVPMAISNVAYVTELRTRLARFEPSVLHVCLVAPVETVHARLRSRGAHPVTDAWSYRRAAECCAVHADHAFSHHVGATAPIEDVVAEVLASLSTR
jgi:chloramphenicol 3-O-phosphotransferase